MKRLTLLLAVVAVIGVPAAFAEGPSASDLEAELVCPTCKTTLDMSSSEVAQRMKAVIRQRLAAGATAAEIKEELVSQFGNGVLAEPPKKGFDLLAWALPVALAFLGIVAVGAVAWAWAHAGRTEEDPIDLDPELDRRVDEELARFEG